jgi:tetratricopeptide (TPR) repeat protein
VPDLSANLRLQEGLLLLRQGAIDEAVGRFLEVIRSDPGNAEALHYLGLAQLQQRKFAEAADSFGKSVKIAPRQAAVHSLLGVALRELGQHEKALGSFNRAIAEQPDFVDAYIQLANLAVALGRPGEAIAAYDRLLRLNPGFADGWSDRSVLLHSVGRHAEALASSERAIALKPEFPEALASRGTALAALDRHAEATASFDRAIAAKPDFPEALVNRGNSLRKLGRFAEAVSSYEAAIRCQPALVQAHFSQGAALEDQGLFAQAIESFNRMLALRPPARLQAQAYAHRAWAHNALGRFDDAFADVERSLRLAPDDDDVLFRTGLIDLLHGRWHEGWPKWERRIPLGIGVPANFSAPCPRWTGEALGNDLLLLRAEQGFGDRIQFSCFIPELAKRGLRVAVWSEPPLAALLRTVPGVEAVIGDIGECAPTPGMRWLPMMSLPLVLATTPDTIPQAVPFVTAAPDRVAAWRTRLGSAGFKVGIAWQGNPKDPADETRSIALAEYAPLADIPDVRLLSLQKGLGTEQIEKIAFRDKVETLGEDCDSGPDALLDTAAVMAGLDLVVTSDNVIAHLAGALGVPAFVAIQKIPDWRWLLDRDDSPWYPTMRLFRQSAAGEWPPVFARLAEAVRSSRRTA